MYRLVPVEYFMDKMNEWETVELINVLEYTDVSSWTQTRQLLSCWVDHKKVKKIQDIMRFPWDPLEERTQDQLTDEERRAKKLRQREELRKITGF